MGGMDVRKPCDESWQYRVLGSDVTEMHIQNNQLTGSIKCSCHLLLDDLNVANNQFNGWIPDELKDIKNLETGGNSYLLDQLLLRLLGRKLNHTPESEKESEIAWPSNCWDITGKLCPQIHHPLQKNICKPLPQWVLSILHQSVASPFNEKEMANAPPSDHLMSFKDKEFANPLNVKRSSSVKLAHYSLADLQNATGNFASSAFLVRDPSLHEYTGQNIQMAG
ncbi:hypothetical protein HAX54_017225 [Datura stramonium]|uniref:Uncharacterized protein n=1 Tax=Datura stramonium TaxID=4076 RepID=A0ABS8UMK1_DATST|nr:hypothetical protein [Datura stramonium]